MKTDIVKLTDIIGGRNVLKDFLTVISQDLPFEDKIMTEKFARFALDMGDLIRIVYVNDEPVLIVFAMLFNSKAYPFLQGGYYAELGWTMDEFSETEYDINKNYSKHSISFDEVSNPSVDKIKLEKVINKAKLSIISEFSQKPKRVLHISDKLDENSKLVIDVRLTELSSYEQSLKFSLK